MLARRLPGLLAELRPRKLSTSRAFTPSPGCCPWPAARRLASVPRAAPHRVRSRDHRRRRRARRVRPGEVSLAHHGILLLDELPEFNRAVLEALRQPLEDGTVSIARVAGRAVYPARFLAVATMNLCPCGARGDPSAACSSRRSESPPTARLSALSSIASISRLLIPRPARASCPERRASARLPWPSGSRPRRLACPPARRPSRPPPASSSIEPSTGSRCRAGACSSRQGRADRRRARGSHEVEAEHLAEALSYRAPRELEGAA